LTKAEFGLFPVDSVSRNGVTDHASGRLVIVDRLSWIPTLEEACFLIMNEGIFDNALPLPGFVYSEMLY
jgi:hypothetical protein